MRIKVYPGPDDKPRREYWNGIRWVSLPRDLEARAKRAGVPTRPIRPKA